MSANKAILGGCIGHPVDYIIKNIEDLNSAFCGLRPSHEERFREAIRKINVFGSIIIARNIDINGVKYWRSVTFLRNRENSINISFPDRKVKEGEKVFELANPIGIFVGGNACENDVEKIIERITRELIKQNQI